MAFKFTYYIKIKDRYCLCYFGHNGEYVVQLKLIRPYLEMSYPDLKIYLSCNKNLFYLIQDEDNVLIKEDLYKSKRAFGNIEEIKCNINKKSPVLKLLENAEIKCPVISREASIKTSLCFFSNKCHPPVKPVPEHTLNTIKNSVEKKGFIVNDNPNVNDLERAGWIIGVENEILYLAASMGIKTTLLSSNGSSNVFKMMFPEAEVFDITKLDSFV